MDPVKIAANALFGVSSAGWGGINSHTILGLPPLGNCRRKDLIRSRKQRNLKQLSAPRFCSPVSNKTSQVDKPQLIALLVSQIRRGVSVDVNTPLKDLNFTPDEQAQLEELLQAFFGHCKASSFSFIRFAVYILTTCDMY